MSKIHVFVSFDVEHDAELFKQLRIQSGSCGFAVQSRSERPSATEAWSERVRRRIRKADQAIFICSEHSGVSTSMSTELRIAQQEGTPYFLLWGRRKIMCTKPVGAKTADGMYRWTRQVLQNQIVFTSRSTRSYPRAEARRTARKG